MEQSFSNKRIADYLRNISQLYRDMSEQKIYKEEAVSRLTILKVEHEKLEKSGLFPINMRFEQEKEKDMQKVQKVSPTPASTSTHELDFKCQCKSCVSKHTITMADQKFLKSVRILWNDPKKSAEENSLFQK